MPRWKYATPEALALISPTRSIRAVLRQLGSWSGCGRSAISVIRPTMTVLPLTTPRNLPTVARAGLPGMVGVSPMVICAPLTASTRPSVSRGARAGTVGVVAGLAAGAAAGGLLASVILAPSVASSLSGRAEAALKEPSNYKTTLELPLSRWLHLDLDRQFAALRPAG